MINQPYASRIENVNPFNVIAWIGSVDLDPASDIWKDTSRMPNLVVNREGNYDTFIARNGGSAINTVWNEWETFWTGEISNSVSILSLTIVLTPDLDCALLTVSFVVTTVDINRPLTLVVFLVLDTLVIPI